MTDENDLIIGHHGLSSERCFINENMTGNGTGDILKAFNVIESLKSSINDLLTKYESIVSIERISPLQCDENVIEVKAVIEEASGCMGGTPDKRSVTFIVTLVDD